MWERSTNDGEWGGRRDFWGCANVLPLSLGASHMGVFTLKTHGATEHLGSAHFSVCVLYVNFLKFI